MMRTPTITKNTSTAVATTTVRRGAVPATRSTRASTGTCELCSTCGAAEVETAACGPTTDTLCEPIILHAQHRAAAASVQLGHFKTIALTDASLVSGSACATPMLYLARFPQLVLLRL
eukprot:1456254-Rhodomonas_salina.1